MYETFGNGGANTMKRKVDTGEATGGGRVSPTSREWYRPLPPYKEVDWSMRNNTNYMQTGVLSALQLTSSFPKVILENFYRKSRNSIESGKKDAPFGYVIPAGQRDMTRVARLVNTLRIARNRSRPRDRRDQSEGRNVSRRFAGHQTRSALRPARENPSRKAGVPRSEPSHL